MKHAYVFPGQGAQAVGMGKDLYDNVPAAKELFEKANEILGFRITDIMFAGTDEELKQTRVTQPAVFLHSVIMAKALGVKPDAAAGHSLGEFSALVVAGSLSFEDGLKLVSKRAMAMQAACEAQPGTMAAILGLEDKVVEEICASVDGVVVAANYNCPGQLVISGAVEAVDAACEKAKAAGARRALRLPVGGAFHSPLMEPAKQELEKAIAEAPFQTPVCPVYQNVDAKPYTDPAAIKANLIAQLTAPVRWTYIVTDLGKVETPGGRRPNIFGLANSAIYFAGVNVGRDNMRFLITDLQNNIIKEENDFTFELLDRPQCIERICSGIENFIATCGIDRGKILGLGVCMTGRVNPDTGRSYKYFTSSEQSLRDLLEERVGIRVLLENDTRARCYAEYTCGKSKDESNVLYLHMGRGVAIGIVVDGQLYYGKSGFAGEFGHIPFFDNEIICSCGKKGCLETEVSGIAIEDKMCHLIQKGVNTILKEKYDQQKTIHIDDIITAAKNDDNLSIELIEEAGEKVGKAVAFLINTFNPETVIVGGNLAAAGDYIMLPLKSATNKYSLNLVYKDTKFRVSKMTENANAWGVAMLIRNKIIGL